MNSAETTFAIGDWIVHSNYGLGQIEGEDSKTMGGEKKKYFKVSFSGGFYWLATANVDAVYVRSIASEKEVKKALKLFKEDSESLPKDHKDRNRVIHEILKSVSLIEKVKLIRDLSARKIEHALNFKENEIFERLKNDFIQEWHLCCGKEESVLREKLNGYLNIVSV